MEKTIALIVVVLLLILNANGYVKVPEQAIALITSIYLGSDAAVRMVKVNAISKMSQGSLETTVQPTSVDEEPISHAEYVRSI